MSEQNVATLERAVEQMNAGNLDGYMDLYADDLTLHGYPPGVEGKQGAHAFYAQFRRALPDLELTADETIAQGDLLAARYTIRGTHSDEFMGVPASGNRIEVNGQSFFRFQDGRVAERWQLLDGLTLMGQMGALSR
jgi:steroid delta-isomerase-like uncharacterized protein